MIGLRLRLEVEVDIRLIIHQLAENVARATDIPKPNIMLIDIPAQQVIDDLRNLGIGIKEGPLDNIYSCVRRNDLPSTLSYIYFDYTWPKYLAERMDCDDFAFLMKSLLAAVFGCNAVAAVRGNQGSHYWNLIRLENEWIQLEPQNGSIMEIHNAGYVPMYVTI